MKTSELLPGANSVLQEKFPIGSVSSLREANKLQGYKKISCSTQLGMNFFLLINVKMPTIVGILTFVWRKKAFLAYMSLKKS